MNKNDNNSIDEVKIDTSNILNVLEEQQESIQEINGWINDIIRKLNSIIEGIKNIPGLIVKELKKSPIVSIVDSIMGFISNIKQMVTAATSFLGHTKTIPQAEMDVNKTAIENFISGIGEMIQATNRLIERKELPFIKLVFPDLDWLFNLIPNFVLNIISIGPNALIKDWDQLPGRIAKRIDGIQQFENEQVKTGNLLLELTSIIGLLKLAKIIASTIRSFIARDLTLGVTILGEGSQMEVSASPASMPWTICYNVIDAVIVILEMCIPNSQTKLLAS
ncbi:hypothetical protein [Aquimarina sp. AU474]|uniref:hypothetical protein n=1 Tax=Aquimarina sp. AU474 TaxID=2108529 RepID=UPI000D696CDA|nr:hypothetical protein [Aquimarina sp. AU474]